MDLNYKYQNLMSEWMGDIAEKWLDANKGKVISPADIKKALWGGNLGISGIQTETKDIKETKGSAFNGDFMVYYDSLPKDCYVTVSFRTDNYRKSEEGIALRLNYGKYACEIRSYYWSHKVDITLEALLYIFQKYPSLVDKAAAKAKSLEEKKIEEAQKIEKREKVKKLRTNSAKTWLKVICEDLTVPYYLYERGTRFDLRLSVNDGVHIEFQIPINDFEKVLPKLPDLIRQYLELNESQGIKVIIRNDSFREQWITNQ